MVPRLIPNASKAWRMLSVQIAALAIIYTALPLEQQTAILTLLGVPAESVPGLLGFAVIIARLVDQPKTRGE